MQPECQRLSAARGYCGMHYQRIRRHGDPETLLSRPHGLSLEEAFRWHMPGTPCGDECWEWPSCRDDAGYGTMEYNYRLLKAHAVSYQIHIGPISSGLQVRHSCDNPPCVSPHHLSLGTSLDNAADRVKRGRQAKGESQHLAKLTEKQVLEIRLLSGLSQKQIAKRYGLSQSTVSAILRRETWKHV